MIIHVSAATAASHTIFTPTSGRRFQVKGFHLVAAATQTVTWKTGSTAIGGAWSFAAGVPQTCLPHGLDRVTLFEGVTGEALVLTLGQAQQLSGWIDVDHV